MNDLTIVHLHRHAEHLPLVAAWIHAAFWTRSGKGVETVEGLLRDARDPDRIPLSLLALVGDTPAGTVNLIACDSRARPDLSPWLAALYVESNHRRRGVGAALVRALVAEAARLGREELFLETDIPEFYERLGAVRHEPLAEGGWIMKVRTGEAA
jgi:predicted N-acetyltransferase YhbS